MSFPKSSLIRNIDNPEMGPGRVIQNSGSGLLLTHFGWSDTQAHFDAHRSHLEPYLLHPGTPIRCQIDEHEAVADGMIITCKNPSSSELASYTVAIFYDGNTQEIIVNEGNLFPLPPLSNSSLDHLKALTWQGPSHFFRRWRLRLMESRWFEDSGGIPGFIGARIHPMGHQIYAARRVLWDRTPRFILADEVGLGKTIEAGLVIQSLLAGNPSLRILVIAPGAMAHQWQTELYLRFGALACKHIDSAALDGISQPEARALLKQSRLVVTTTVLQTNPSFASEVAMAQWDMVAIDEAHQFPPGTNLYDLFLDLARRSSGLLALSATPSKREITSLSGLLALVAPDIYSPSDHEGLAQRLQIQRGVWDQLRLTREFMDAAADTGEPLEPDDLDYIADEWDGLIPDDTVVQEFLIRLRTGEVKGAHELVAYVQEFHRLDHRIIRTRRSTLQEKNQHWSTRQFQVLTYDPHSIEEILANHLEELPDPNDLEPPQLILRGLYYRAFSTTPTHLLNFLETRKQAIQSGLLTYTGPDPITLLTTDPGPADESAVIDRVLRSTPALPNEQAWLDSAIGLSSDWLDRSAVCARTDALRRWLLKHLEQSPDNQVLVFSQETRVVSELTEILGQKLNGHPVQAFHHGIPEPELANVALQFQHNKNCRVLISDELGGEGRNFQNASALVHFDLPWSVARMEQRIGRLDRVGRGGDRPVLSVVVQGPNTVDSVLAETHSRVFQVLSQSIGGLEYALPQLQLELNQALCHGPEAVKTLHPSLEARIEAELREVDDSFELSLDASKIQLENAHQLAEILGDSMDSQEQEEAKTLAKWAKNLGMKTRSLPDQTWKFAWDADELRRPIPTLPPSGFIEGTFIRQVGLHDESRQFLGPGHPFVDAIMRDIDESADGRATVMAMKLKPDYQGKLFALVLGRCDLDLVALSENPIPTGLLARSRRHLWPEVQPVLVELKPGEEPAARLTDSPELTFQLRGPDTVDARYQKIPPNLLGENVDTLTLWASVDEAQALALATIRSQRQPIVDQATKSLEEELRPEIGWLTWRQRQVPADTLDTEIHGRQRLIEAVRNERVSVEAVAVIIAVP